MNKLLYVVLAVVVIGVAWYIFSSTNNTNTMAQAYNWVGSYSYYHQVPDADDGTTDYKLYIVKDGDNYMLTFESSGMSQSAYKAKGVTNNKSELVATFDSVVKGLYPDAYKKDQLMFTLSPLSEKEVAFTYAPYEGGAPGKTITFERVVTTN